MKDYKTFHNEDIRGLETEKDVERDAEGET